MAPSWVLLDRRVLFSHDAAVFGGGELIGDAREGRRGVPSLQEMRDAIPAYLQTVKPDAYVADPPKLSYLHILRPTKSIPPLCQNVTAGFIASADKNLVALYAGPYRPGTHLAGCYLIYDARKSSLSMIPQVPFDDSHISIGCGAVVMCDGDGEGAGYVLAELIGVESSDIAEAALWLWQSPAAEWVMKVGRLPLEVCPPTYVFTANMCFSFGGSILCWVDLLKGMVVCDLRTVQERNSVPEFRFIPLPKECTTYTHSHQHQLNAETFRSMACVGGDIKFITMDGYVEHGPNEVLTLTMWTLSPDLSLWKKGKEYHVKNIWENETHQSLGLPKLTPSFPVLSMHEDDVVYLVFTDVRVVNDQLEYRGQYMLRVDMGHNKVQFYPGSTKWIHSQPFASEFSAYRQGLRGPLERGRSNISNLD